MENLANPKFYRWPQLAKLIANSSSATALYSGLPTAKVDPFLGSANFPIKKMVTSLLDVIRRCRWPSFFFLFLPDLVFDFLFFLSFYFSVMRAALFT